MPRWLHRYGPKKYQLYEHVCALLVRLYSRLSYRRAKQLLDLLGISCPSKSALQWNMARLGTAFWQKAIKATSPNPYCVAIDSTGFPRTNPSYHYLKRIDGKIPQKYVKLSVAFDTRKKRFCDAKARVLPVHDIRDAPSLMRRGKIFVADKAYNAESLYERAFETQKMFMSPAKKGVHNGFYRRKMQRQFRTKTYNRRQLIEAGFSSIKRKFGSSVSSKKARTIRSEVYGRLACHNLFGRLHRLFGQSLRMPFQLLSKAYKAIENSTFYGRSRCSTTN